MAATDTAARIRSAALAAIDKQCFGEDFGFDASPAIVGTPGGPVTVYTLIITMRSPLRRVSLVPPPAP